MTPAGARVLEDYRLAQARLAAEAARTSVAIWPLLTRGDQVRWIALVLALIRRDYRASALLAQRYMTAYRTVERVPGEFVPELGEPNDEKIISSMLYMGPRAIERAIENLRSQDERPILSGATARKIMESNARAVQRHVLAGGREVVDDVLRRDPARKGYMRLTDGDPCFFCAMLASRGPVYQDDSFDQSDPRFSGAGDHKVHDGCACQLVPIYGAGAMPLQQFKRYERLWAQTTKSGSGAIKEFRQLYENRRVL